MEVNKRIGDYEILDELGSGGMGRVFLVRNVISDRVEAMKVLLPDLIGRQDLAARFLREIKVLAALSHPNIAALRTALTADNQLVMIMEYVEGQSLATRLRQGPIVIEEALAYVDQVLDALGYAHDQHVVHRDIKPANMMLTPQGVVKLTDFGIARSSGDQTLTVVGTTTGSLSYMSPEQVNGEQTDARSDLYSAGISLYEMVTGHRPFEANSDFGVMLAHLKEQPKAPIELQPGLPPEVNAIILKAIAKNPAERFQSASEFRDALRKLPVARRIQAGAPNATVYAPVVASPASNATTRLASFESPAMATPLAGDHARTVLDTGVPAASGGDASRAGGRSGSMVPPKKTVHPGVYMALGAVLLIAAMIGTGVYLRRAEAGSDRAAGTSGAPAPSPPANPVVVSTSGTPSDSRAATTTSPAPPISAPPAAPAPAAGDAATRTAEAERASPEPAKQPVRVPVTDSSPRPVRQPDPRRSPAVDPGVARQEDARVEEAKPAAVAQDSAALDQLEDEIDQLSVRAGAVNNSLDRLQQEQARQGLGLRGDMAARQESMKLNLSRAQEAIGRADPARARKYRDLTERDVEALEKFLGR